MTMTLSISARSVSRGNAPGGELEVALADIACRGYVGTYEMIEIADEVQCKIACTMVMPGFTFQILSSSLKLLISSFSFSSSLS